MKEERSKSIDGHNEEPTSKRAVSLRKGIAVAVSVILLVIIAVCVGCATVLAQEEAQLLAAQEEEEREAQDTRTTSQNRRTTNAADEAKEEETGNTDETTANDPSASIAANDVPESSQAGEQAPAQGAPVVSEPIVETPAAPTQIAVYVSIDTSAMPGYSSYSGTVYLEPGASVFSALCATGAPVSGSSSYVSAINGLAEFAGGTTSGWTYYVNGVYATQSCGSYALYGGETVAWVYVL